MKDIWYADNRDIIKWGGIVCLCIETGIKHIFQIAYFRQHSWPVINFNNKEIPIPDDVLTHFRSVSDVERLGDNTDLNIHVVTREFEHYNRDAYHSAICGFLRKQTARKIVFLDPDTGLAPQNAKVEHVRPDEVSLIWQSLKRSDFLVLYQHRFRNRNWINIRRKQLAEACNINERMVKEWIAPKLVDDVVFFFCEKKS